MVGDVIGKFHPHGDQAVYDAMVRLAQDFAQRYPLIEGQGNFGNIDGDNAAAYRYTEARLTEVAALLIDGIDEDAVDFRDTYNGEDREPVVLPGAFPNLLANGASGIAVGMATSVPPHNAAELCDAALHLIKHPDAAHREADAVRARARTSRPAAPSSTVRATHSRSLCHRPGHLPGARPLVGGAARPRHLADRRHGNSLSGPEGPAGRADRRAALTERKLPLLADVRDESAEDVRLVLEPKSRTVDPRILMEQLFRSTDLEARIPLNMNVLSRGRVPGVLSLQQVLRQWLDHRRDVLLRRSRHRLAEIGRRLEVLGGYLIAYLNLDEVIRIIREEEEPKPALMQRFDLTDVQAEAILNMRLRALRKLEEIEIRKEHKALTEEKGGLESLLASEEAQWQTIADQVREVRDRFGKKTGLAAAAPISPPLRRSPSRPSRR